MLAFKGSHTLFFQVCAGAGGRPRGMGTPSNLLEAPTYPAARRMAKLPVCLPRALLLTGWRQPGCMTDEAPRIRGAGRSVPLLLPPLQTLHDDKALADLVQPHYLAQLQTGARVVGPFERAWELLHQGMEVALQGLLGGWAVCWGPLPHP